MRQRFRARELWLFLPFLLIGALAIYWARAEKSDPPNAQGIFVSDFKIEPSPGMWRGDGYSHQVTVTLFHRGKRPDWWGNRTAIQSPVGAFQTSDFYFGSAKKDPTHAMAFGSTLFFTRDGKKVAWKPPGQSTTLNGRFFDDHYIFLHQVSLAQAPQHLGEIGFRGLYVIGEQEPFVVERTLRVAGETVPPTPATRAGIKLLDVDATGFYAMTGPNRSGAIATVDTCDMRFTVRDFEAPPANAELPQMSIYDITFTDENGKKLDPMANQGFSQFWTMDLADQTRMNGQRTGVIGVEMTRQFKRKGRLRCRGKIAIGQSPAIAFDVILPPRQSRAQNAGGLVNFPVSLWHNGARREVK